MDPCINIALCIYKPEELFQRTMLARVVDPSQDNIESQGNSQSNRLAAGIEHPEDDQLIVKIKSCPKTKV